MPGSLSIDGNDVLHLTWLYSEPGGGLDHVLTMENPGTGWTAPVDLIPEGRSVFEVDGATHTNGSAHVVWQEGSGAGAEIWYGSDRTGSWQIEQVTLNGHTDLDPSVAVDGYGRPHATWVGEDPVSGSGKIFYAERAPSGSWSIEVIDVSSPGSFWEGADPRIAVSETGIPYIVYRGGNYRNYDLHLLTKTGETWTLQDLPTPNHDDYGGSVRTSPSGNVHIASGGNDGFGFPNRTYYNFSTDGGTSWQGWDLVSGTYNAGSPVLALTAGGEPHILWEEISGTFYTGNIYHSWYSNNAWQSERLTFDSASYVPSAVTDGSGGVHVVYYDNPYLAADSAEVYYVTNSYPTVRLTITPPADPEVSPGGTLYFSISVTNLTPNPLTGDLWLSALLVGSGNEVLIPGSLLDIDNPTSGTLPAWGTVTIDVALSIPPSAPAGLFQVIARAGNFGTGGAADEARFVGLVLPTVPARNIDILSSN
jgi:hypothetical protein